MEQNTQHGLSAWGVHMHMRVWAERQRKEGFPKQQSKNAVILFYAQYNGHIKIIRMLKKFATDRISSLRQDKEHTFYPIAPAKYIEKPWTIYIEQPSEDLEGEKKAGWLETSVLKARSVLPSAPCANTAEAAFARSNCRR